MKAHPCRQTIRDLADWADLPEVSVLADPHLRSCADCTRRVQRARQVSELLRSLPPVVDVASAGGGALLPALQASICDERAVGNLLRSALPAVQMPFDVPVVSEIASGASARRVGALMESALPPRSGPAWMWHRVRADLRSWLVAERSLRRHRVARWFAGALMTAAAVLVVVRIGTKLAPPAELRAVQVITAEAPYSGSLDVATIMEQAASPVESVERK